MNTQELSFEVADGVGRLTLNRPEARNALTLEVIDGLRRAATQAAGDPAIRALLITGTDRAFCAGADVKRMMTPEVLVGRTPREAALDTTDVLHRMVTALYRLPKPVICAVNGAAAGAGLALAMIGDVVWASASATFRAAYTAIGLSPDGGSTFLLPRVVGPRLAAELMLTNRTLTAEDAHGIGLVSRVLPDGELLPAAEELARQLAGGATQAFAELKALLRATPRSDLETQLEDERQAVARAVGTADFAEGVMAFIQKRPPNFSGR
ncbi:MAG: enoyl-CoA hydratase/isomerase family protein [Deltaproteobacteria bacterium]|nr:enoyl-CoA hydratase/isomerase family protein [Deltaproteobacteria bacterium]